MGTSFESHSQYAMGRPQPNGAFLDTHLLRLYINGVEKNTKKYRKWSLPTRVWNLIGLNTVVHHSRLL